MKGHAFRAVSAQPITIFLAEPQNACVFLQNLCIIRATLFKTQGSRKHHEPRSQTLCDQTSRCDAFCCIPVGIAVAIVAIGLSWRNMQKTGDRRWLRHLLAMALNLVALTSVFCFRYLPLKGEWSNLFAILLVGAFTYGFMLMFSHIDFSNDDRRNIWSLDYQPPKGARHTLLPYYCAKFSDQTDLCAHAPA